MELKQTIKKITVAGLTAGALFTGLFLSAQEINNAEKTTYIKIPLHVFNKMTGTQQEHQAPEFFIYQDGKLVKCTTDLTEKMTQKSQKNIKERKQKHNKRDSENQRGMRKQRDSKFVLLTVDQMETLKKQKLEQKIKDLDNNKNNVTVGIEKASKNAVTAKVDEKEVKVITMRHCKLNNQHSATVIDCNSSNQ